MREGGNATNMPRDCCTWRTFPQRGGSSPLPGAAGVAGVNATESFKTLRAKSRRTFRAQVTFGRTHNGGRGTDSDRADARGFPFFSRKPQCGITAHVA